MNNNTYSLLILVEKRKWINEDDFREGFVLAELAPGPLAAQLSIYLGYVHYKGWITRELFRAVAQANMSNSPFVLIILML